MFMIFEDRFCVLFYTSTICQDISPIQILGGQVSA